VTCPLLELACPHAHPHQPFDQQLPFDAYQTDQHLRPVKRLLLKQRYSELCTSNNSIARVGLRLALGKSLSSDPCHSASQRCVLIWGDMRAAVLEVDDEVQLCYSMHVTARSPRFNVSKHQQLNAVLFLLLQRSWPFRELP
jgi:hypothetical protein